MPNRNQDRMPAVRYPVNGHSPNPVERIEADEDPGNSQESQSKQRKRRQQFANRIKLKRADDSQQPPHPLTVFICLRYFDLTLRRIHGLPRLLEKPYISLHWMLQPARTGTSPVPVPLDTLTPTRIDATQVTF